MASEWINDKKKMEEILRREKSGVLGVVSNEQAYTVPMNYVYYNDTIYLHSESEGRKIEAIEASPHVIFLVYSTGEVKPGKGPFFVEQEYESVMAFGKASLMEDPEEKRDALELLIHRYLPDYEPEITDDVLRGTSVIKIDIYTLTGKRNYE